MSTPMPFDAQDCRAAQCAWSQRSIAQRLRCVRSFRHLLAQQTDELTAAVEYDVARSPVEVLASDVLPLAEACRFLERKATQLLKPRRVERPPMFLLGERDWVYRRPHGVVGIIGTWNYPILLNGVQLVQALVAGNGVMWKPSEFSESSSTILHRLLGEAGIPDGLVQLLPSERTAGPRLLESEIDHLVFTGSAGVGRQIAIRCAERMIPSTLELSGIDAMFVLDDADIELAAKAAWFGVTLNRGQTCLAVRRIFVQAGVYKAFCEAIRPLVDASEPMKLVTTAQADQARQLLNDARSRGGTIWSRVSESLKDIGSFVPPQLVINAAPDMDLCQVDCFAPIAAVMKFETIDRALDLDAKCSFALGANIFTGNQKLGKEFAGRLRTGSVCINDAIAPTAHPATPFGGRCSSGWGTTQGAEGLLAMTVPQVVSVRGGRFRPHYATVSPALENLLRGMLNWSHAPRWNNRWKGLWNIMRSIGKVPKR